MRMIQGGAVEKCEEWQRIYFEKRPEILIQCAVEGYSACEFVANDETIE